MNQKHTVKMNPIQIDVNIVMVWNTFNQVCKITRDVKITKYFQNYQKTHSVDKNLSCSQIQRINTIKMSVLLRGIQIQHDANENTKDSLLRFGEKNDSKIHTESQEILTKELVNKIQKHHKARYQDILLGRYKENIPRLAQRQTHGPNEHIRGTKN